MYKWLIILSLLTCTGWAQPLPILEQNPTGVRWYQLKTPHFTIIYPEGLSRPAQYTAHRLEQVYGPVSYSLNRWPRRLPVLLQNQTMIPNGFVTLLPRHSAFFVAPPQDPFLGGTLDWLDLLAVHELRHVVQYEKALQGFSRVVYWIFGNGALSGLTLGIPDWFWEGDAVGTESVLTNGGRGRIPNFDLGFRANLLEKKRFNYSKAVGGSFRDNVPNHYVLGYFLSTYAKRTFRADAWSRVLDRYYRFPIYPFSFSNSIKQTTGLRVEDLYQRTLTDLKEIWQKQREDISITPVTTLPVKASARVYTNYQYPQYFTNQQLVSIKSGLGDISQFVVLNANGNERRLFVPGLVNNPEMLSVGGGKVAWTEFQYDPRFEQRVYSSIKVLDIRSGKLTRLTRRSRYAVASLSSDGAKLVAVRNDEAYQTRLVVLDAFSGRELRILDNPNNDFFLHPRWRDDNRTLVAVVRRGGMKSIEFIDTETDERRTIVSATSDNLSHPVVWKNYLFFNSPRSGIDNIYVINLQTGVQAQVTSRPLGAYHPAISPDGCRLAFHDFRGEGYRVVEMPLDSTTWIPVDQIPDRSLQYFRPIIKQEIGSVQVQAAFADSLPLAKDYAVRRFRRLENAFNIYSWGPFISSENQGLIFGINSRDLLSTTQINAGLRYNQVERAFGYFADLSYQGLYPVIDFSVQGGRRNTSIYVDRQEPIDSLRQDRWHYDQLTAGFRLPLQLTRSKYLQSMTLSAHYSYQRATGYDLPVRYLSEVGFAGSLHTLTYGLFYSRIIRQSKRDVAPRWGQTLSTTWRTTLFGGELNGELWAIQSSLFFPGFLKHHSFRFRGGYQQQTQGTYRFGSSIFYPRGYLYASFDRLTSGSVEYRLPLLNPHWSIGRWLYIQRVKANLFYDAAQGESNVQIQERSQRIRNTFYSRGIDVSFVFNVMRLRTPFEAGVRTIYNGNTRSLLAQALIVDIGF